MNDTIKQILLTLAVFIALLFLVKYISIRTKIARYELLFIQDEWTAFTNTGGVE